MLTFRSLVPQACGDPRKNLAHKHIRDVSSHPGQRVGSITVGYLHNTVLIFNEQGNAVSFLISAYWHKR